MSLKILDKLNYLAAIRNSEGSRIFKNLWAEVDGVKRDILEDGDLSCAQFVSGILYLYKLINDRHATVDGTVRDLENYGWYEITNPKEGCVIVWEGITYPDGNEHKHIGFYLDNGQAISNSPEDKSPKIHNWTYGNGNDEKYRKVSMLLWHKDLDQETNPN